MKGFEEAVELILLHEGGYSHDAADPGGETNRGISKRQYPNEDIAGMTVERAKELYRRDYWDAIQGDLLPYPIALVTFDGAVNAGPQQAIKWLQSALGVTVDGVLGPQTLTAANRQKDAIQTASVCCQKRILFYTKLPIFSNFGAGWVRRVFETFRAAAS